ncbi:RIB43A-like with coiled-coils protein 2 [Lingula anatina]|uniref:RIB43A-like with coiled-coils protein 2 n=1 Tax=Lingula anatina TaxID=7574 RepID=A0A1S3JND9_LINAN|nr:RIB43A-like with coiled-coils protein 2 [Lingula anatina]|eukprot:XP_013411666.1 RIB43A-like with coiled-coils protein 2 [Lingula anatina]
MAYKLDLPIDLKEAASIERRRNMEEERKSRIFNAKVRLIGIDRQAVEQQVRDRKEMEEMERRRHEAFAADAVRCDRIAELLTKRQEHDIRQLNHALNEFRQLHQQPSNRREWDLYDPDSLKKDKPARVSDDDPRCGISGLQKFDGEDLNNKARTKYQQEQLREWSERQKKEREQAEENQRKADRLYELKMRELDERAMELQKAEEACRRAINHAQKDFNHALAAEQAEKRRLNKQQEEDDNATELANHIYGDVLTENPAVAQSAWGPHRVITDRWKGMSPKQLDDIKKTQDRQRKENERLRQEEDLRNKEWDAHRVAHARAGMLIERELDRQKKEILKQQAEENRRLASEQKASKDYLYKEVYTNPPTASYFMQFNTSTR